MLIVGTGGHAMDSFEVWHQRYKSNDVCFFNNLEPDFEFSDSYFKQFGIIKNIDELRTYFEKKNDFILGLGNPKKRELLTNLMVKNGGSPFRLISESAIIGSINNVIEDGVTIMNGTVVTINCFIGYNSLINTNVTLAHDCRIESYVEIAPGANIAGNCTIKEYAFVGIGATILPNVTVGEHAIVAAGSVVLIDVPPYTMVAGNPAVVKKNLI